jgi:hypothetical protein
MFDVTDIDGVEYGTGRSPSGGNDPGGGHPLFLFDRRRRG